MFDVVLSTIETKLQRVENLDRAVHHLMRKMDMMERKLSGKDADIMAAIQLLEKETHEAHVSVKLNQLSAKLDSLCQPNLESASEADILIAQPSNRKSRVLQEDNMEDVKEVINGIDRRLGLHINIVSENLGKMSHMVEEVRNVLIDEQDNQTNDPPNSNKHKRRSKFDQLLTTFHPLLNVSYAFCSHNFHTNLIYRRSRTRWTRCTACWPAPRRPSTTWCPSPKSF